MDLSSVLAQVIGSVLVLSGLSLFNTKHMLRVVHSLEQSPALTWIAGFITFVIGLLVLAKYNVWSNSWYVLITIFGWLALIKGVLLVLFPEMMWGWYKKMVSPGLLIAAGVIALILGIILLYVGLVG